MKINHLLFVTALLTSCVVSDEMKEPGENEIVGAEFTYETIVNSGIHIQLNTEDGEALSGVKVSLWNMSPLEGGEVIFKAITDQYGSIDADYNFPASSDDVIIEINHIGMPNFLVASLSSLSTGVEISGLSHNLEPMEDTLNPRVSQSEDSDPQDGSGRVAYNAPLKALGDFDRNGKPKYLEDRDVITSTLLEYVNASLPEGRPVPEYHPSYLEENTETNLNIVEEADVWMTFVHEGAGYKNTLGFYTYETGNPPETVEDIDTLHIAFPNASYGGYGGDLRSGDKVRLGRFAAGTSIGFVLLANAWKGYLSHGQHQVYSHKHLNPEPVEELRQHIVMLWDDENQLFLIGFEDLNRYTGSDNDFNDAVIYITSNPVEAISTANVNPIDKPVDTDGDGVNDVYDEFPIDANYAYSYAYPGESSYGTFAFEDQWPGFGDYDFNDLVVDYQYRQYADNTNKMVMLESEMVVKAIGAGFKNGLGIQIDIAPESVNSVDGSELSEGLFPLNGNGTESGQAKTVIPISDNVHRSFGTMGFVNTDPNLEYLTPDTIIVGTNFTSPVSLSGAGVAPFNPFLVINQTRGREVHLPGYEPTDLVDDTYFGEGNDDSDPEAGKYYKSKSGLPWGMNLPESFAYPMEKNSVRDAYSHFDTWANSDGFSFMDWYQNKSGYRRQSKIYKK